MDTKEKRITRILKRKNGNEIEADEMLKDKYARVFGNNYLERVEVIDIQTAYNDYQKLHDDLHELAQDSGYFENEGYTESMQKETDFRRTAYA